MTRWNEIKVHVTGVPLSSVRRETVGLVSSFLSVATMMGVGVVVWKGGTTCASSSFASCDRTKQTRPVCTLAPRLRLWKRGPLAPVVGEGVS